MAKYYTTTLQKGSKGDDASEWQRFLNSQGYNLTVDGDFGDNTYNATVDWQTKNGLTADGIVGDQTWGKAGYTNYSTLSTPTDLPEFDTTPNASVPTQSKLDTTSYGDTEAGKAAQGTYNDAKEAVDSHEGYTFTEYTKGEDVLSAEGAYNDHLANKPGEYSSQWLGQLDDLMNQIMNREKFSYDLNGDALYQQYKDKYVQQGKLAMMDTMGQAAAMNGGYGSSYAQSVGQQAYQGQLDNLNDIVPELYAMARENYIQEGQDLYNQYGMVMDRENQDYERYMDTLNTWLTDRGFLAGRVDSALNFDYGKHMDAEGIKQSMNETEYARLMDALGIAQGDLYHGEEMYYTDQANKNNAEIQRFNEELALYNVSEEQRQYYNTLLQQGFENKEAIRLSGLEEYWNQKEWNLTEEQWDWTKSQSSTSGSGGNGGNSGGVIYNSDGTLKEGYTTNDTSFFDENGNFKKATFSRYDSDGNAVWYIDGKEVIRQPGANPYTGAVNPDTKNGTFSNGYQPNNIGGQKLTKSGITDTLNGVTQNVWKTPDGTLWIWDGTQNKYLKYGDAPKKDEETKQPSKTGTGGGGGGGSIFYETLKM